MNKTAIITAFLGGIRNRYMKYQPDRTLAEKLAMAAHVAGCDGVELCYPADFEDFDALRGLLNQHELGVAAINFRSRREGKWWRGSFTSEDAGERREVVDDFKRAMDFSAELGANRVTTCPLNEGTDSIFEADFIKMYDYAAETLSAACAHNRDVRVCLEYKVNDPRARCLLGTAGETASFCMVTGADNLGATFDIGHSLLAGERPAQAAALMAKTNRMIPGAYHVWEFVELFYTLRKLGYDDDWYAFDVFAKEVDQVQTFNAVMSMTRKLEGITDRIDPVKMELLLAERNPAAIIPYLYSLI
jgi:xylose isomerase